MCACSPGCTLPLATISLTKVPYQRLSDGLLQKSSTGSKGSVRGCCRIIPDLLLMWRNMCKSDAKIMNPTSRTIVDKMRMRRIVELYDALDPEKATLCLWHGQFMPWATLFSHALCHACAMTSVCRWDTSTSPTSTVWWSCSSLTSTPSCGTF